MSATWRSLGTLCREQDWPRARLLHEIRTGGVECRTNPPGHKVDWHHPEVERTLDVAASTVTPVGSGLDIPGVVGFGQHVLGIEARLVDADETPATPPAGTVTDDDLKVCILAIKDGRP